MPKAPSTPAEDVFSLGPRIRLLPIIHGSGDCAIWVRDELLARPYDCLAVPLPPSFQDDVESAVERLPTISAVVRRDEEGDADGFSYVPIDPCQGVVAAIRTAIGERIPRAFIDMETSHFEALHGNFPDPYALKRVRPEAFAAALLPAVDEPGEGQHADRIHWMAAELRELERKHQSILFPCSILDWPWIRDAYSRQTPRPSEDPCFALVQSFDVDPRTLVFFLGELPFITNLYERGRRELTPDDNLSIDGVKELVLAARDRLRRSMPKVADRITPHLLATMFRYVRNLALVGRRLTPDLYSLVVAAKQTAGDDFALAVAEAARQYAMVDGEWPMADEEVYDNDGDESADASSIDHPPLLRMGLDQADVPGWGITPMVSRLPGQAVAWRRCELKPRPRERDKRQWKQQWNPFGMCSWPPEDDRIESFHQHVREQARAIIGEDLARTEKFSTSLRDGLDIRETLRNWHTGDLYVKVQPPSRGTVEIVVFFFEYPADPKKYVFRTTWYAEHDEESTLAFYATDPTAEFVGPGIARAEYGGALFLYPPRPIPDVWTDPRLDVVDTLEERLLAAALRHSKERHVAIVSPKPPSSSWRRLAKRYGRKLVHLPLSRFGGQLVERLRTVHILNGKHVRSFAADFIRET